MANVDVNKLIEDAKAAKAAADAKRAAAQKTSAAFKSSSAQAANINSAIVALMQKYEAIDPELVALERAMTTESGKIASGSGSVAQLQGMVKRYNALVAQQNDLSTQAKSIVLKAQSNAGVAAGVKVPQQSGDAGVKTPATGATTRETAARAGVASLGAPKQTTTTAAGTTAKTTTNATGTKTTTTSTAGNVTGGVGNGTAGSTPDATEAVGATGLTAKQQSKLGTYGSEYLIKYFQAKYPDIYKHLLTAAKNGEDASNVEAWLKNTQWYKDTNQRYSTTIAAAGLANGLTLSQSRIDAYRDQVLAGVISLDEVKYDLGVEAIDHYQLAGSRPDIAKAIQAGATLADAVADYASTYKSDLGLSDSAFDVSDPTFMSMVVGSKSITEFQKKVRHTDAFLNTTASQSAISDNSKQLQQKYASYGLTLTAEAAWNLGKNLYLGDTTQIAVNDNLMKQAADIFTPFRDRILAGDDPLSLASPYLDAMSRILEIPSSQLSLSNETVRNAMMGSTTVSGDKTTTSAIPIWQFEQQLYRDPRWQFTANARAKLDSNTTDILSRFGVIG